jgi:ADP-ribosylglycohydrolase
MIDELTKFAACLVASAVGDALGAPIEFSTLSAIRREFGPAGMRDLAPGSYGLGAVTDDTQLAIATARGLIEASKSGRSIEDSLRSAYVAWLESQSTSENVRAPGNTCLSALREQRKQPASAADNNSWGCGGVMRVHPIGLAYAGDPQKAFEIGNQSARLTHGHPRGVLPSGMLAAIIAELIAGKGIDVALAVAIELAAKDHNSELVLKEITDALDAVDEVADDTEYIESTEGGWRGDTALAIGLFCFLRHLDDPLEALAASVNHSGDSGSTGTVCGALLGAVYGIDWIPATWLEKLEHREELVSLADALFDINQRHAS